MANQINSEAAVPRPVPASRYSYVDPVTRLTVLLLNPRPSKAYRGFVDAERADNGRKVTIEDSRLVIR
jgi:hypothetical protein